MVASYLLITVLTADILAMSGNIALTWSSPILPKLLSNDTTINPFEEPITENEKTWIGSLVAIGAMLGPFPFGYIAARFGRKIGLLSIAVPQFISYMIFAFSTTVEWFCFARTLNGLALGGGYALLPMYMSEVAEDSNRGMFSVTINVFWTIGHLLSYVIGPYTSVLVFNVILSCFPLLFFIIFLLFGPETPYYLVMIGKIADAEHSLLKLRNNRGAAVEEEIKKMKYQAKKEKDKVNILDFFKCKTYLKGLLISFVLVLAQQFSGVLAVLFYTQEIFTNAGAGSIPPEISSIIIGIICVLSSIGVPFVADRAGRRIVLMISCIGTTIAHVAFGIYFYLKFETKSDVSSISWLPLTSLMIFFIIFSFGFGPMPWTISSELFPTNLKPLAAALTSFSCWFITFFVTKFFDTMRTSLGEGGTFWLFGGCCFATFLFVWLYVPETKGKSFGEIQEMLEK